MPLVRIADTRVDVRRSLARLELARRVLVVEACRHAITRSSSGCFKSPELTRALLRLCEVRGEPEARPNDLTQIDPIDYRADAVFVFRESAERASAVIVEVQRSADTDKQWTWPLYITALRAREKCDVHLLVFAFEPAVARWARRVIETAHPGFGLAPIVIATDEVPAIRDPDVVRSNLQLAVLSALATHDGEVGRLVADEIRTMPTEPWSVYFDELLSELPALRDLLETDMKHEYKSEFARTYYAQGVEKGLEKGREAGRIKRSRTLPAPRSWTSRRPTKLAFRA